MPPYQRRRRWPWPARLHAPPAPEESLRGQPRAVVSAVAFTERNDHCHRFPSRAPRFGVVTIDDEPVARTLMPGNSPFGRRIVSEAVIRIEMILRNQCQHGEPRRQPVLDQGLQLPG